MKKYGYTVVVYSPEGIRIESTDSSVLERAKAEITRLVPTCYCFSTWLTKTNDPRFKLPDGKYYYDQFSKLDGKDRELGFWLIRDLVSNGWEPFASGDNSISSRSILPRAGELHLRIEYGPEAPNM